jgi:hypothetical protein
MRDYLEGVYIPHLLIHTFLPICLGPLCALLLVWPLAIVLAPVASTPLFDVAVCFSGAAWVGFCIRRFTELSKGAVFSFLIPLAYWLPWTWGLVGKLGVTAAIREVFASLGNKGCCPNSFVFMILVWTAAGYTFGAFGASYWLSLKDFGKGESRRPLQF